MAILHSLFAIESVEPFSVWYINSPLDSGGRFDKTASVSYCMVPSLCALLLYFSLSSFPLRSCTLK